MSLRRGRGDRVRHVGPVRDAMRLAMAAVPPASTCRASANIWRHMPGVDDVHDLHVWALSTTDNALTRASRDAGGPSRRRVRRRHRAYACASDYSMHHATLQVELGTTQSSLCAGSRAQRIARSRTARAHAAQAIADDAARVTNDAAHRDVSGRTLERMCCLQS